MFDFDAFLKDMGRIRKAPPAKERIETLKSIFAEMRRQHPDPATELLSFVMHAELNAIRDELIEKERQCKVLESNVTTLRNALDSETYELGKYKSAVASVMMQIELLTPKTSPRPDAGCEQ